MCSINIIYKNIHHYCPTFTAGCIKRQLLISINRHTYFRLSRSIPSEDSFRFFPSVQLLRHLWLVELDFDLVFFRSIASSLSFSKKSADLLVSLSHCDFLQALRLIITNSSPEYPCQFGFDNTIFESSSISLKTFVSRIECGFIRPLFFNATLYFANFCWEARFGFTFRNKTFLYM